ncbi:hypothetical protein DSO57_1005325 [Entomophthora muscae]|uniref:Uncharacterized protein n=1 Tax=Entomophthora muscae TaxID=34485 RepID=A0ACC2UTD0_9FUNG|nr:hypothetical protein DSO57_1005325 [Entomophthora muscae]
MPADFVAPPPILENENCVTSQCPEFYAEDALMLYQFCDLANQLAPNKRKSKEQDYQEDLQKVVKKKYKVAEIKKYLEVVTTALAGGFN